MALPNIFSTDVADNVISRINQLTPSTQGLWGKMNVAQMLAHCNVAYEMVYDTKHPKPPFFVGLILKWFVKKNIVNEVPYPKNGRTAPAFIVADARDFEQEQQRLIAFITKTQQLGEAHFDQKKSHSFGKLSKTEWNNLFYKHLDHHLGQFGV